MAWQAAERKEPLEKQQNLRIETVMAERHRLLQSPVEGAWKVSILDDAHRLTADAANVLLKILEEPPSNTAIFLVTPFRDRLFATILSRCQPVRFRSLDRTAHLSHDAIEAAQDAEHLWQALSQDAPRASCMKPARAPSPPNPAAWRSSGRFRGSWRRRRGPCAPATRSLWNPCASSRTR